MVFVQLFVVNLYDSLLSIIGRMLCVFVIDIEHGFYTVSLENLRGMYSIWGGLENPKTDQAFVEHLEGRPFFEVTLRCKFCL